MLLILFSSVPGGELQRVLDDEDCVPERDAARLLRQILSGVSFLHEHNIAHLDLKVSFSVFMIFSCICIQAFVVTIEEQL